MPRRSHRLWLVVDASVARAASRPGAHAEAEGRGAACTDALEAIRKNPSLGVAFSPRMREEWDRHQSGYAATWRSSMMASKRLKLLEQKDDAPAWLEDAVERARSRRILGRRDADAVTKDRHLVGSAFAADRRVVSLDEAVRRALVELCALEARLRSFLWVSPEGDGGARQRVMAWIEKGCPEADELRLCPR